ncbi:MAG: TlpA family protein disulfide reductase [Anaerolineales bacterium]|nr:TlpA family protein disulfide reductase [Anaerolineales bacterium]
MENLLFISSLFLWGLMVFNILLTLGLARRISRQFPKMESLKPGQPAPDFTAWTLDGEPVTRAAYAGKETAFIFVSPTCGPCREEVPKLDLLRPQAEANGLLLVLVSGSGEEETRKFLEELGSTLPVLVAPPERTSFMKDYKAMATPSFCWIGHNGKVQRSGVGSFELGDQLKNYFRNGEKEVMSKAK